MRSGRTAKAGASRQSVTSSATQVATSRQARVPKGRGVPPVAMATPDRDPCAAEVAAVGSIAGTSEVDLTTARLNEVVPYQNRVDPTAPLAGFLSGHAAQMTYQVILEIPRYDPGNITWQRYTRNVEFYMQTIFPGTSFDLNSPTQQYTPAQDQALYNILLQGATQEHFETLEEQFQNKGAEGFRHLDELELGDIYKRRADAVYNKDNLWFTEGMNINTYGNKLNKVHTDLIKLGIETQETCAMKLLKKQVNRLPSRFSIFAREQQRKYLRWDESTPPCIKAFLNELRREDEMIKMKQREQIRAPTVHATLVNQPGVMPDNNSPVPTPVVNSAPVQATGTPTQVQSPPPGPGGSGRGRTSFNDSANRREWQKPYQKKRNSNYNYNNQRNRDKPTCTKCGKSGRGHTAYECWQPDCTRCKQSSHTLSYCRRA